MGVSLPNWLTNGLVFLVGIVFLVVGISFTVSLIKDKKFNRFIDATFSNRIWLYQDLLKSNLDKLLQQGLISGKNPKALARDLKNTFDVSIENAERLMITELARVQTEAQKQSFERNGFEEYTFLANSGCCGDCQALNGKHFKVKDMMPGENAAPLHPRCRCSVAAYSDRQDYQQWLDYLEKGGSTKSYTLLKERADQIKKNPKKALEFFGNSDIIKLDSEKVRIWYVNAVSSIKDNIPKSYTMEEKAIQAFNMRNNIRILAREMMIEEEKRKLLYNKKPNKSFEEIVKSKMEKKQLTREQAVEDIYITATKTNKSVNRLYGVEGG